MFLNRIRKKFSEIVSHKSTHTKEKANNPTLNTMNNNHPPTHSQVKPTQASFPENYFDSDSLFK